jgi:hypothetical protein
MKKKEEKSKILNVVFQILNVFIKHVNALIYICFQKKMC